MPIRAQITLENGGFEEKLAWAKAQLTECNACPRQCSVNRSEKLGYCKVGRYALVSSSFAHFGEENCLRGTNGSGTIFFSGCNLRCVFCQNYEISQDKLHSENENAFAIAQRMLALQRAGCHNINFVSPEHVVPQVIEAIYEGVKRGVRIPIVYNTSAYDDLESLAMLEGLIDVYMPDFKYWHTSSSKEHLKARAYPEVAREAILEMHRQVGELVLDSIGLAQSGLLIRHLVMPSALASSKQILKFIHDEVSANTYTNIMDQYYPTHRAFEYPELSRKVYRGEMIEVFNYARSIGLKRLDMRNAY